jgi:hypothetical protein
MLVRGRFKLISGAAAELADGQQNKQVESTTNVYCAPSPITYGPKRRRLVRLCIGRNSFRSGFTSIPSSV